MDSLFDLELDLVLDFELDVGLHLVFNFFLDWDLT